MTLNLTDEDRLLLSEASSSLHVIRRERQRLEKEIRRAAETIEFLRGKLARPEFLERAPAEIVDKERERLGEQEALRVKLAESLGWIGDGAA